MRVFRIWFGARPEWLDAADASWTSAGFNVTHVREADAVAPIPPNVWSAVWHSGTMIYRHRARMASDLVRYRLLSERDGIYADSDIEFLGASPDDAAKYFPTDVPVMCQPRAPGHKHYPSINNCLLGSHGDLAREFWDEVYHKAINRVVAMIQERRLWVGQAAAVGIKTGPIWMNEAGLTRECHIIPYPIIAQEASLTPETLFAATFGMADFELRDKRYAAVKAGA